MKSVFSPDSPFMNKVNLLADFILLNLCFVISCIPIFTIGAATVSLYEASFSFIEKNDTGLGVFWRAFRSNFKTATPAFLLMLAIGLFLIFDLWLLITISLPFSTVLAAALAFCLVIYLFILTQFFLIQAKFHCTLKQLLSNSFLIAFANIFRTLVILVMAAFPILLLMLDMYFFMSMTPILLLAYYSLYGYFGAKLMAKPFARYAQTQHISEEIPPISI